ncbi:MAG: beta-ketoacyl-[acyl-carrier-protein] synthase II, partial [Planctomycetota bacterium]|nr:beta-ketoacyl-[acyl-carrier-protein] synthase II [Planctomycetota bacterium]
SGAIQAVAMLESMRDGKLPGISGLEQIEDGLPINSLTARTQDVEIKNALINSIGLDGNSCALVIGAPN